MIGGDLRFGEYFLDQLPRLALRPIQREPACFVACQRTLRGELRVGTRQRIGQQHHVQA